MSKKCYLKFGVAILLLMAGVSSTFGDIPASERAALVALYYSTDGDNWNDNSNWLVGSEETWYGVTITSDHVIGVGLNYNNLVGTIPSELGNLTHLQGLAFVGNDQLGGFIPPSLGNLTNLTRLWLSGSQLTGPIPPELGNLENLYSLRLQESQLDGSIPLELGNITNLQYLFLGNQLTGSIPPELGNLTNLKQLTLGNNLTGSLPPELGNLTNLEHLGLSNNQLTGQIPPEFGNLSNLRNLQMYTNQLTGPLPPELGNLTNLTRLHLAYNQLQGIIPRELGNLTNLWELWLGPNQLEGCIPWELGNLTNLRSLYLHTNQLTGYIPPELGNLINLQILYLYGNQLEGNIPFSLGNLTNLQRLIAHYNQLEGPIPSSLGNLTNLEVLVFGHNQLSGDFPLWLGSLTNLQNLDLEYNQLTGCVPPDLGNLIKLEWLTFGANQLGGTIPHELGNLTNLRGLQMNRNKLSGPIPDELGNLTNLDINRLFLEYNALYTNNYSLRDFLNSKSRHPNDIELTQTIAPTDVTADFPTTDSVTISWTPIRYNWSAGGYRVFSSTSSGGPYTLFDETTDKNASSLIVTGLNPGITYYLVVQTVTYSNSVNDNTVLSEFSQEVSATTISINEPPVADAGEDRIVPAGENGQAEVTLNGTGSSDPNLDPLTYNWTGSFGTAAGPAPMVILTLGTHTITLFVDDGNGETDSDTVQITVEDQTPPTFESIKLSPNTLWPPNHKMVSVSIATDVSDNCDLEPICRIDSVTSNEPIEGLGDGDTAPDWIFSGEPGDLTLQLRAERSGTGIGRIYMITVQCSDASGNTSEIQIPVTVPHSKNK